jgi:hypothetical protein
MQRYFILFLTHGDRIFGSDEFTAADDAAAVMHAEEVYRTSIGKGFEIWRGDRHVYTETY